MRRGTWLALALALSVSCGGRQAGGSEEDEVGQMDAPLEDPQWSECAMKGEVETCAEVCELQGMECVPNACAADPEFCEPEGCEMATQLLGLSATLVCADPPQGGYAASECEAPVDWISSNVLRCCCAEPS